MATPQETFTLRLDPGLAERIRQLAGPLNASQWIREAIKRQLEREEPEPAEKLTQ